MRVFIAIQLPEYVRASAARVRGQLSRSGADIKWVEEENYHITLKFLGDVDKQDIMPLNRQLVLAGAGIRPFKLALSEPGGFPNLKRPRVLFLGLSGQIQQARELGDRIDTGLSIMGFKPDYKRHFHLTLGRFRSERMQENIHPLLEKLEGIDRRSFRVKEYHLMESRLSRQGPEYIVLDSIKLEEQ
jgi:2'-5' RNA ligase